MGLYMRTFWITLGTLTQWQVSYRKWERGGLRERSGPVDTEAEVEGRGHRPRDPRAPEAGRAGRALLCSPERESGPVAH